MPGAIDGYALAKSAHEEQPNLKVLLTSGFTHKREEYLVDNNKYLASAASKLLEKPYSQSELAMSIRQTLDDDA